MNRARQAGDSKIGCLIWILLFATAAMIAYRMIPVKIKSVELYDYMDEMAKFSARASPEKMKLDILKKARELDIPLDEKNVKVSRESRKIKMDVKFMIPVEFPGYVYEWNFHFLIVRDVFIV